MTIKISGMITNDDDAPIYRDWLGMDVVSPKDVTDNLPDDGSDVDVEINSYGGEVDPAAEIYTALRSYKGNVTTKITSAAYSAASIIAMAGDVVQISPTAQLMIHESSGGAEGNKHAMQRAGNMMDATDKAIANSYAAKSGRPVEDFLDLMAEETWLPAQEAKDLGLVDEIMTFDEPNAAPVTNSARPMLAHDKFERIKALITNQKQSTAPEPSQNALLQRKLAIFYGKEDE